MNKQNYPPSFWLRLFRWYCHPRLAEHIEGDLLEEYAIKKQESGKFKADAYFVLEVLLLFRPGIIRPFKVHQHSTHTAMYKNYLKISLRNILKNKTYSAINIGGLAMGMSVAIVIGLWMWDELSFNSYFTKNKQLAQAMVTQYHEGESYTGSTVQMPLGEALQNFSTDIKATSLASWNHNMIVSNGATKITGNGMWVQPDFPAMFTLKMISGQRNALRDPSTMLITKSLAKRLFGNNDPLNKLVRIDNTIDMLVGGVFEDLPGNTTFKETELLLPWGNKANGLNTQEDWLNHCGQLFVELHAHSNVNQVNEKIRSVPTTHIQKWKEEAVLQPITDLHLYNEFTNGKATGGRITFVWLFGLIGVFVLLLACINFMNLSTARSQKRAKEVGIRKTIGSARSQLVNQFLSESVALSLISLSFAIIIVELSLPFFSTLAAKRILLPWTSIPFWLIIIAFTLVTGLIAGSYPALYLSSFRPVKILKGNSSAGVSVVPRRVLVIIQFTVSTTLIIGTLIVFEQIEYAKNREAGFTRDGLITVGLLSPELHKNADVLMKELIKQRLVENSALASQSPAHFFNNNSLEWRGKDPGRTEFFRNVGVSADFGKTVKWTIIKGRDFSPDLPGDTASMILSSKAAEIMGFADPVGELVEFRGEKFSVIGVVDDMQTQSPYSQSEPTFFITKDWMSVMILRLPRKQPVPQSLAAIKDIFNKLNPESPFDYKFVEGEYGRKFSSEERIGNLAGTFSILAIIISCLGLFGLVSFVAEQRTKEIGIRKILGASVIGLWQMLSRDFIGLIALACCISVPLSAYFMNTWLIGFEYRVHPTWTVFAFAAGGTVMITIITISVQAVRVSVANPVRSLRSE